MVDWEKYNTERIFISFSSILEVYITCVKTFLIFLKHFCNALRTVR
jgi:hypothetical protein